jgi:hypothetical protein
MKTDSGIVAARPLTALGSMPASMKRDMPPMIELPSVKAKV